jgi:hypothetical protein
VTESQAPRPKTAPTEQMLALHARDLVDASGLWHDGLAAFRQALDPLQALGPHAAPHTAVQVRLLRTALRALAQACDLADEGQAGPARDLVRPPFEQFIAAVYVRHYPDEHARFAEPPTEPPSPSEPGTSESSPSVPSMADMKDRLLASMLPKYGETIARGWRQKIDRWDAHLAPNGPAAPFELCVEHACGVLALLLRQAVEVRRALGHPDVPAVQVFAWRYGRWRKQKHRARAASDNETGGEPPAS